MLNYVNRKLDFGYRKLRSFFGSYFVSSIWLYDAYMSVERWLVVEDVNVDIKYGKLSNVAFVSMQVFGPNSLCSIVCRVSNGYNKFAGPDNVIV